MHKQEKRINIPQTDDTSGTSSSVSAAIFRYFVCSNVWDDDYSYKIMYINYVIFVNNTPHASRILTVDIKKLNKLSWLCLSKAICGINNAIQQLTIQQ